MAKNNGKKTHGKCPIVSVEYPSTTEAVTHPSYTMRVAAAEPAAAVEIAINNGEWRPCREGLGWWWYDWNGYGSGRFEAVARLRRPDGSETLSEPRTFEVKLG